MLSECYGWKANKAVRPNLSMIDYVLRTTRTTSAVCRPDLFNHHHRHKMIKSFTSQSLCTFKEI